MSAGAPQDLPGAGLPAAAPLSPASVAPPADAGGSTAADPPSGVVRREVSVVNLANVLTVMRLALVPVFVAFMLTGGGHAPGWRWAAFTAYAVAAGTDQVDGYVARRRDTITDFGILVDPIADKALTMTALVCLSALGDLSWAVTVLLAVRELGVTLLRLWVIRYGVIAASRGGKMKTLLLNSAIGLYVMGQGWPLAREVILAAGVVVAVATGADYVGRALTLRRRAARGRT